MLRGETHCAPINFKPTWLHNSTFILVFPRHFYKTLQTWYSMSQSYICHKIWGVVSKISHLIKIIKVNHHHDLLHHTRSKSSIIHASACSFPSMHWREGSTAAWLTVLIHGETYSVSHLYKDKVFVPSKIWRKTNEQTKKLMSLECISSDRVWSQALTLCSLLRPPVGFVCPRSSVGFRAGLSSRYGPRRGLLPQRPWGALRHQLQNLRWWTSGGRHDRQWWYGRGQGGLELYFSHECY